MVNKTIKSIVIGILLVAFGLLMQGALKAMRKEVAKESESKAKEVLVTIQNLQPIQEEIEILNYGTVEPKDIFTISCEVDGKLEYLHPDIYEGNLIQKDALLFGIDAPNYALTSQKSLASLNQDQAELDLLLQEEKNLKTTLSVNKRQLELAEKELLRYRQLIQEKSTSFSDLNRVETTYQTTLAAFVQNENALALLPFRRNQVHVRKESNRLAWEISELDVKRTKIASPIQGRILKKYASIGEYVKKGQKLLEMYDSSCLEIQVPLAQNELIWIIPDFYQAFIKKENMQNIVTKTSEVLVQLINSQETCFWKGKITRLAPEVDVATRTLSVVVRVEADHPENSRKNPPLLKGTFVKVKFKAFILKDVYKIPRNLITNDNHVAIFENGKLAIRPVEILRIYQDFAYISKGLKTSDKLITSLLPQIVDGMPVTTGQKDFGFLQEKKQP